MREPPPPLLDYQEAAKVLGCSDRSVWAMVHRGDLRAVRLPGRLVRIDPRDLDAFIQKCKGASKAAQDGN